MGVGMCHCIEVTGIHSGYQIVSASADSRYLAMKVTDGVMYGVIQGGGRDGVSSTRRRP